MADSPLLEVKHLSKDFHVGGIIRKQYFTAVDDVSFSIAADEPTITTLAGESGSGKTTISRLILGLLHITSGEILYRGRNLKETLKHHRLDYIKKVQAVFQDPYAVYNPFYTVDRLLQMPIRKFKLAESEEHAHELILEALDVVGLTPERVLGKYPHQLSGGEAQRLAIARALLPKPDLLIADEPVSMVDMSLRAGILNVLLDLKERYRMSILFVTHDLSVAYYLSDNIIMLNRGQIVEMGNIDKVIKNPLHAYVKTLMSSIPLPTPEHRWKDRIRLDEIEEKTQSKTGCIFHERCPYPEGMCSSEKPDLYEIEENHFVACHCIDTV